MTNLTIRTNDEISINGKRLGWIMTYNQAKTKGHVPFIENAIAAEKSVFWPMTEDGVRGDFIVLDERLDDRRGKVNPKLADAIQAALHA